MIFNLFSRRDGAGASDPRRDGAVALILFLFLGLVFAPVIGLHVAMMATAQHPAAPGADDHAHHAAPPTKPSRG